MSAAAIQPIPSLLSQFIELPVEVRIPKSKGKTVTAGYFDNLELLKKAVKPWDGQKSIYFTINPVDPALLSRCYNRLLPYADNLTADDNITRLMKLLIDIDVKRPSGISATEQEKEQAINKTIEIREYLMLVYGIDTWFGDSGNGGHTPINIDLANTKENITNLQNILIYLGSIFDDTQGDIRVSVDKTTFNPSRITKLYGTVAVKGDNTPERPHRRSRLITPPATLAPQDITALINDANNYVKEQQEKKRQDHKPTSNISAAGIDAGEWLARHNIEIARTKQESYGTLYILEGCPMDSSHEQNQATTLIQMNSGALSFKCLHDRCSTHTWADLRRKYEPRSDFSGPLNWDGTPEVNNREEGKNNSGGVEKKLVYPAITNLGEVEPEDVNFLWEPYIPIGKLTLLEGDPGLGKTFLALNICAAISNGWPLPEQDGRPGPDLTPGKVLFMTAEDGLADTLAPRLDRMGADRNKIYCLTGWRSSEDQEYEEAFSLADVEVLRAALEKVKPDLVVIDPLQAYIGGIDMHRANETRPLLSNLGKLAEEYNCAILAIRHLSKGGSKALYRGLGSIDFTAAARSVLLVGQEPESQKKAMVHIKSSLALNGVSLSFDINHVFGFSWTGISNFTAEDLLITFAPTDNKKEKDGDGVVDEAMDFLNEVLERSMQETKEIKRQAKEAGISWRSVERAKQEMGFKARKVGEKWYWPQLANLIPDTESTPPQNTLGGLGGVAGTPDSVRLEGRPPRPPTSECGGLEIQGGI